MAFGSAAPIVWTCIAFGELFICAKLIVVSAHSTTAPIASEWILIVLTS